MITAKRQLFLNQKKHDFINRYINKTFNQLTIISISHNVKHKTFWNCICSCGAKTIVETYAFSSGKTKSCGCLIKQNMSRRTHGYSHTSEYHIWLGIKGRCYNTKNPAYNDYGGRGIKMSENWKNSFSNFINDMGYRPSSKYSIDRIDNNKGYSKENCRWATQKEQCRNKRINKVYEHNGKYKCLKEWAEYFEIPYKLLWRRLKHGWSFEESLTKERLPNGSTRRLKYHSSISNRQK